MPKHPDPAALEALESRIGHRFAERARLVRALTHRSASPENMERFEFLGDAVLGLVIASALHAGEPDADEGRLSRLRSLLVRRERLAEVAQGWALADCLIVGKGERVEGRLRSPSIAANAVEAVIGAVFEDGGFAAARQVVLAAWSPWLSRTHELETRDAKTRLQEYTQARGWGLPVYHVEDGGDRASPRFRAVCEVRGRVAGRGAGARRKLAESQAAAAALAALEAEA